MLSDEEKQAIEHLTKKMKYHKDNTLGTYVWLTLDEHYVRIILKLVENLQKDIESWKKYCNEQENDITLKNNKICDLEFKIEKQSKEIEELKEERKSYAEEYIYNNPWLYKQLNENYILRVESEQKERKAYIKGTNDAHELCNKKWEDKIKAKIEELDEEIKVKKEIAKNPMDRVSGRLLTDNIVELEKTKKVLQSLLEKE